MKFSVNCVRDSMEKSVCFKSAVLIGAHRMIIFTVPAAIMKAPNRVPPAFLPLHKKISFLHTNVLINTYPIAGYFQGGNISRMPSGAIVHEEKFPRMHNLAILNSAKFSQGHFSQIELNFQNS